MKGNFVVSILFFKLMTLSGQTESYWYHNNKKDSCPIVYFCPEYEYDFNGMFFIKSKTGYRLIRDTMKFELIDSEMIWAIEKELPAQLKILNKGKQFQINYCPDIELNLYKYSRQYFSYVNKYGEHVILINFFMGWGFERFPVFFDDGCSYYWNIKYCVKEKLFYNLMINGEA